VGIESSKGNDADLVNWDGVSALQLRGCRDKDFLIDVATFVNF